jgi:hypothetical protein
MRPDSEVRESILIRCKSVIAALDDCPAPGLPFSRQQAQKIIEAAQHVGATRIDLDPLNSQLDEVIKRLQVTDDAKGEKVLSQRRWEKYFADQTWES